MIWCVRYILYRDKTVCKWCRRSGDDGQMSPKICWIYYYRCDDCDWQPISRSKVIWYCRLRPEIFCLLVIQLMLLTGTMALAAGSSILYEWIAGVEYRNIMPASLWNANIMNRAGILCILSILMYRKYNGWKPCGDHLVPDQKGFPYDPWKIYRRNMVLSVLLSLALYWQPEMAKLLRTNEQHECR